jgi:hypothetical protein
MKGVVTFFLALAVCAAAVPTLQATGHPVFVAPQPTHESQFYWDDGIMSSGWCWFSGGNYWAVQFDEEKTDGIDRGIVEALGAMTYPGWPDAEYQGVYLHIFTDEGGYPGEDTYGRFFQFEDGGEFEWLYMEQHVYGAVFYVAFQQIGDYPDCDTIAVDAASSGHNWTGYQGSWARTSFFGDFMLRCYWNPFESVEETSWGWVKALY